MTAHHTFTAATNKLAYAQSFGRPQTRRYTENPRGRGHFPGRASDVMQTFVRHRHVTGRHRSTTSTL